MHLKPYWELIRHRVPETVFKEIEAELKSGLSEIHRARILSCEKTFGDKFTLTVSQGDRQKMYSFGTLINASGVALNDPGFDIEHSYVLGPAARPSLWEITAIPEIRAQTEALAQSIHNMITGKSYRVDRLPEADQ